MTDIESQPVLTNRQGHPVYDNQNQRTVGERGPATLENYQFLEKISHFDRERIPERFGTGVLTSPPSSVGCGRRTIPVLTSRDRRSGDA